MSFLLISGSVMLSPSGTVHKMNEWSFISVPFHLWDTAQLIGHLRYTHPSSQTEQQGNIQQCIHLFHSEIQGALCLQTARDPQTGQRKCVQH
ncbi:hypothetical protein MHYP_G00333070 [Metynnis hypsauchen]